MHSTKAPGASPHKEKSVTALGLFLNPSEERECLERKLTVLNKKAEGDDPTAFLVFNCE